MPIRPGSLRVAGLAAADVRTATWMLRVIRRVEIEQVPSQSRVTSLDAWWNLKKGALCALFWRKPPDQNSRLQALAGGQP